MPPTSRDEKGSNAARARSDRTAHPHASRRDRDLERRFFLAQTFLDLREGEAVTHAEVAKRAAKALPMLGAVRHRRKAPEPSTIFRYKTGEIECPRDMKIALAVVYGVDPGWLWFFPHSAAPAPEFAAQAERLGSPAGGPRTGGSDRTKRPTR